MNMYYVLRNKAWTHTVFMLAADVTDADRVAHDGSEMKVVKIIQARTQEIADALFDAWQEHEEQERVHNRGCDEGKRIDDLEARLEREADYRREQNERNS